MSNAIVDRLRMRLDREAGMSRLDEVVLKYGFANGEPMSFKDHEFQQEIIKDTSSRISVRKCSQVGLSELMVQKLLAMTVSMQHARIIFTLPTKDMASMFAKDRIDGAIEQSSFYTDMTDRANNSASQKKIGSCVAYIAGTMGARAGISVPAEVLICDELDFSDQVVVGKLNSRLRHATIVDQLGFRGLRFLFSTPTVTGYGIDAEFQKGSQKYYMVKCEHCGHQQAPSFYTDFIVPGFDDSMEKFTKEDAQYLDLTKAYIRCANPNCHRDLFPSLLNPARREWVALHPDRNEQSYQVNPWDVPVYNNPLTIASQIMEYPLASDYFNFVLGLPYSDTSNSFITEDLYKMQVKNAPLIRYQADAPPEQYTVAGLDVGKHICHLTIGRVINGRLQIIWAEKIPNSNETPALPAILARYDYYRCSLMCVDSGPDFSLVNSLTKARNVYAVVYVRDIKGPRIFEEKSNEPVVNVARTKALSYLLEKHNSQKIDYPRADEPTNEIFEHLKTTKKIRTQNADGTFSESFRATSDIDHWVHSINYMNIAAEMRFGVHSTQGYIPAPISIGKIRVGSTVEQELDPRIKRFMLW